MNCPNCGTNFTGSFCPNCGTNVTNNTKKSSKLPLVIIGGVLVLVLGVISLFLLKGNDTKEETSNKVNNVNLKKVIFFLKNSSTNKYALFNADGDKLTDFVYTSVSTPFDGKAFARTGNTSLVLDEQGYSVVSATSPSSLYTSSGYYLTLYENGKTKIITSSGKEVFDATGYSVEDMGDYYITISNKKEFIVFGKEGKELIRENVKGYESKYNDDSGIYANSKYALIFLEGTNYLFDKSSDKLLTKFESDTEYCMEDLSNGDTLLSHCRDLNSSPNRKEHKVISNGKVIDVDENCYDIDEVDDTILCTSVKSSYNDYFLTSDYKLGREYSKNEFFYDEHNYVKMDSGEVVFIRNDKEVKRLKDYQIKTTALQNLNVKEYYALYNRKDQLYHVFTLDGKEAFNYGFKVFNPSKDNIYRVKTDEKYYLMNSKGNKLTKEYDNIYYEKTDNNSYYSVKNNDKYALLDKKENEIYSCSDCDITVRTKLGKNYASFKYNNYEEVVDLNTKKVILKLEGDVLYTDEYIKVRKNNKESYYTYSGKTLFEN